MPSKNPAWPQPRRIPATIRERLGFGGIALSLLSFTGLTQAESDKVRRRRNEG
jgi:hypothetical protein